MAQNPFYQTKGIRGFTVTALTLAATAVFCSCGTQNEDAPQAAAESHAAKVEQLQFRVSCEGSETRGTPQEVELNGEFAILGATYAGDWNGTQSMNYIYNGTVVDNGSYWRTVTGYAVPDAGTNMRFFAYFPAYVDVSGSDSEVPLTLSAQVNPGMPYLSYDVPTDAAQQHDLMVALTDQLTSTGSLKDAPIDLTFKHLLTAVCFKVDASCPQGLITKIVITDVKYRGDYTFGNETWTAIGTSVKTVTMSTRLVSGVDDDTQVSDAFMLMPQTLGASAKVQVTFNNGRDYVLETSVGGKEWAQGKLTTYTIKMSSLKQMTLTASVQDWGRGKNLSYDTTY
ncbi:MAG: fimbrillin family protein [Prevotella sp.]|nr:fimbrillin family protein [Prevotella sp.]